MIQLSTTTRKLQLVTGSAGSIGVYASWIDWSAGTVTPNESFSNITTATSTDIVTSPAASTSRRIKFLNVENSSTTVSNLVTLNIVDGGTTVPLISVTLLPGETIVLDGGGQWHHHDANGIDYVNPPPTIPNMGATGTIAETIPRQLCPEVSGTVLTSGTLNLQSIYLSAGQTVTNITYWSATTAAATPTNGFFALYDFNRNLLAQSANFTTEAWAANSSKTKAMTSAYKITKSGIYYTGIMIAATTVPTLKGAIAVSTGAMGNAGTFFINGNSTAGLTTTLPSPAAAITSFSNSRAYAAIS